MKKKVLLVFGTRPEAIKMCPVAIELKKRKSIEVVLCVTGQHRQMLDQVLCAFNIVPDIDLSIMKQGQTLYDITISVLDKLQAVLQDVKPDLVLVQGDTTTAFAAALSCFYSKIPLGHIEAGLRTDDIHLPFPEEFNRRAISLITKFHFAPTESAKLNLNSSGISNENIFVTGNTSIDALKTTVRDNFSSYLTDWVSDSRLIIVTAHRRENHGKPLQNILRAVQKAANDFPDIKILIPIHLNPEVLKTFSDIFFDEKIKITGPLNVIEFHNLLARCYLIMTDSGGIQEEAPSLGKPVLVIRDVSERQEGILTGVAKLIGTTEEAIYNNLSTLLEDKVEYQKMSKVTSPYGDGQASKRIVDIIEQSI